MMRLDQESGPDHVNTNYQDKLSYYSTNALSNKNIIP